MPSRDKARVRDGGTDPCQTAGNSLLELEEGRRHGVTPLQRVLRCRCVNGNRRTRAVGQVQLESSPAGLVSDGSGGFTVQFSHVLR